MKGSKKTFKMVAFLFFVLNIRNAEAYFTDFLFGDTAKNAATKSVNFVSSMLFSNAAKNAANTAISIAELATTKEDAAHKISTIANIFAPYFFQSNVWMGIQNKILNTTGNLGEQAAHALFLGAVPQEYTAQVGRTIGENAGINILNSTMGTLGLRSENSFENMLGRLGELSYNYAARQAVRGNSNYLTYAKIADRLAIGSQITGAAGAVKQALLVPSESIIDTITNIATQLTPYAEALEAKGIPSSGEQVQKLKILLDDKELMKYVNDIEAMSKTQIPVLVKAFEQAKQENNERGKIKIIHDIGRLDKTNKMIDLVKERRTTTYGTETDAVLVTFLQRIKENMDRQKKANLLKNSPLKKMKQINKITEKAAAMTMGQ